MTGSCHWTQQNVESPEASLTSGQSRLPGEESIQRRTSQFDQALVTSKLGPPELRELNDHRLKPVGLCVAG